MTLFLAVYTVTFGVAAAFLFRAGHIRHRHEQTTTRLAQDGTRTAENYANNAAIRAAIDNQNQPRKETP